MFVRKPRWRADRGHATRESEICGATSTARCRYERISYCGSSRKTVWSGKYMYIWHLNYDFYRWAYLVITKWNTEGSLLQHFYPSICDTILIGVISCVSCFPKICTPMLLVLLSKDIFFNVACLGFHRYVLQSCLSWFSKSYSPMLFVLLFADE